MALRVVAVPLLALAIAALVLPSAQAAAGYPDEPGFGNPLAANVTLFLHVNGFQEFPINTQRPSDQYHQDVGVGITTSSTGCGSATKGTPADREYDTWYGFSSPGLVEYNYTPDGRPYIHPERGLSDDVHLLGDTVVLHWYLSTQTGVPSQPQADPNQAPVPVPDVVVQATLRTGESVSADLSGYNAGTLIAQGQTAPATLALAATQGATWQQVGGQNVYGFDVPLKVATPVIPKDGGFSLRVDAYLANPYCSDPAQGAPMPNLVRVHSSPEARPRMDVRVASPIHIDYLHPQFLGDDLVIHASVNAPWGNYDVDAAPQSLQLHILDAQGATVAQSLFRAAVVQRSHEHGAHTSPVDVAYIWPFHQENAPPGTYTVHLEASNLQRTATAYATAQFTIGDQLSVVGCGQGMQMASGTMAPAPASAAEQGCVQELQNPDGTPIQPVAKPSPAASAGVLIVLTGVALLRRR